MDLRLSMPKALQQVDSGKFLRNSGFDYKPVLQDKQVQGERIDLNSYKQYIKWWVWPQQNGFID